MKNNLDINEMLSKSEQAAGFLKSIANANRLGILCQLLDGEITAGELSRRLGITGPNLSQHLTWLKRENLVLTRREGTVIHYRMASERIKPLMNVLYTMFCEGPEDE